MKEFKKIRPIKDGTYLCFVYIYRLAAYKLELLEFNNGKISYNEYEKEIIGWEENKDLTDEDKVKYFNEHVNQISDAFNGTVLFEGLDGIDICNSFYELLYKYQYFYYSGYVASIDEKFIIQINQ